MSLPAPPRIEVPANGFEDLVDLGAMALPDLKKDPDGKLAQVVSLYRTYLRNMTPDRREAPLLVAARHAMVCSRSSGRPSLRSYASKTVMGVMVPKMLELCEPSCSNYTSVVATYHDNGLFANMLQVYDMLYLSNPEAAVLVDWRRDGSEGHFQYGPEGFDLWSHLFEACGRCKSAALCSGGAPPADALVMKGRVSCIYMNMLRGYIWTLPGEDLANLRRGYAAAVSCLRPVPRVLAQVDEVCGAWDGAHVVGAHKRLGCPEAVACQLSQRMPAPAEFIARARAIFESHGSSRRQVLFLATDDLHAVAAFEEAFPAGGPIELCCRAGVKRSEGGLRPDGVDNEVHRSPCEAVDAEDALVDALCLCRCQDLVCIDSNLPIFAAMTSPEVRLHPLNGILPDGWEEDSRSPPEPVHAKYEVVHKQMVFIRSGPSAACELLGAKRTGEVVATTGRMFDGWIEIAEGGWMLIDAEQQAQGRGQGFLLRPWSE